MRADLANNFYEWTILHRDIQENDQ